MESQPQDPEFRNNPENSHPCIMQEAKSLKRPSFLAIPQSFCYSPMC